MHLVDYLLSSGSCAVITFLLVFISIIESVSRTEPVGPQQPDNDSYLCWAGG